MIGFGSSLFVSAVIKINVSNTKEEAFDLSNNIVKLAVKIVRSRMS
jgi:hypothetical protein